MPSRRSGRGTGRAGEWGMRLVAFCVVVWCASCCSNHHAYFSAKPLRYCSDSKPIELSWMSDAKSATVTATPPIPELAESRQSPFRILHIRPQATSIELDFGPKDNRPVKQIARLGPDDSALLKGGAVAACVGDAVGDAVRLRYRDVCT